MDTERALRRTLENMGPWRVGAEGESDADGIEFFVTDTRRKGRTIYLETQREAFAVRDALNRVVREDGAA